MSTKFKNWFSTSQRKLNLKQKCQLNNSLSTSLSLYFPNLTTSECNHVIKSTGIDCLFTKSSISLGQLWLTNNHLIFLSIKLDWLFSKKFANQYFAFKYQDVKMFSKLTKGFLYKVNILIQLLDGTQLILSFIKHSQALTVYQQLQSSSSFTPSTRHSTFLPTKFHPNSNSVLSLIQSNTTWTSIPHSISSNQPLRNPKPHPVTFHALGPSILYPPLLPCPTLNCSTYTSPSTVNLIPISKPVPSPTSDSPLLIPLLFLLTLLRPPYLLPTPHSLPSSTPITLNLIRDSIN